MIQTFFTWYDSCSAKTIGHAVQSIRKIAERHSFTRMTFDGIARKLQRVFNTKKDLTEALDIAVRRFDIKYRMYAVGCWYELKGDAQCHPKALEVRKSSGGFLAVTGFKR